MEIIVDRCLINKINKHILKVFRIIVFFLELAGRRVTFKPSIKSSMLNSRHLTAYSFYTLKNVNSENPNTETVGLILHYSFNLRITFKNLMKMMTFLPSSQFNISSTCIKWTDVTNNLQSHMQLVRKSQDKRKAVSFTKKQKFSSKYFFT